MVRKNRNLIWIYTRGYIIVKKNIISVVENSKVMHPIVSAATKGNRYWNDFLMVNKNYEEALNENDYKGFLDKSHLDFPISMAQYLQFSSEVTVVDYIIRNYSDFKNEPKYNDNKNPECSFSYKGRTINVEVKCPDLSKRVQQENSEGIKVIAGERFPNKNDYIKAKEFIETNIKDSQTLNNIDRLDNKLKDYLISAHQKFPVSSSSNFNVLVVALDIIQDMDEWYSYLFGKNGAFTDRTYITDDYSNVDAVMITNVQHGHMADDVNLNINCWDLENYVSLLFLNPQKEKCNGLGEYYQHEALNLFGGFTNDFLAFQIELDDKNATRKNTLNGFDLDKNQKKELAFKFYTEDKITELEIISKWVKTLKKVD